MNSNKFITNSLIYGLGLLLLQTAGFILLPVYTNYLTTEEFGILEIVERTGNFVVIAVMGNGISTAAFSFYCQATRQLEKNRIATSLVLATLLCIFVGMISVLAFSPILSEFLKVADTKLLICGLFSSLFQLLPAILLALKQARLESLQFVASAIAITFLRINLVLVFVAFYGYGLWGIFAANILTNLVASLFLIVWEFLPNRFVLDWQVLHRIIRFAWPFIPNGLVGFLLFNSDRLFLARFVGQSELGMYSLASKIASVVGLVAFNPIFKVWSADLYRVHAAENSSIEVGRWFTTLLFPYISFGLLVSIFHREIITLLASKSYHQSAIWIPPLILAGLLVSAQTLMDGSLYFKQRTSTKPIITSITLIFCMALMYALVPRWHLGGAVAATVFSMFIFVLTTYLFTQNIVFVRYEWGRLSIMIGSAIVLSTIAYLQDSIGLSIPGKLIILLSWPSLLWKFGFFTSTELSFAIRTYFEIKNYACVKANQILRKCS